MLVSPKAPLLRVASLVCLQIGAFSALCAAVQLKVGDVVGAPAETVLVTVYVETDGLQIGEVRNDISFDFTALSLNFRGATPDCSLSSVVGRHLGIELADNGARIKASIIPIYPSGPIRDGPLYSCGFTVSRQAQPGIYDLEIASLVMKELNGTVIPEAVSIDGSVTVQSPEPAILAAGEERGWPGGMVSLPVRLASNGRSVAATANELGFDPSVLQVHRIGGQPDCTINPLLGKILSVFVQAGGDFLVAQILPEPGVNPMPDAELYRCTFEIDPEAPEGPTVVSVSGVAAWDPEGLKLEGVLGSGGTVVVEGSAPCVGDCDGDSTVSVDEIVLGVNIALGVEGFEVCETFDHDLDRSVTVDELVRAVGNALIGC